jgi:hypothetical protein
MEGASRFNMESGIMFEKDGVTGTPGIFIVTGFTIGSVTRNNSSLVSMVCPAFDFGR